jgi:hypothetical protein
MRQLIIIITLILSVWIIYAQQAGDSFSAQPDVKWEYKVTVFDSLNNGVDSLYYYKHDLFFEEIDFEGKLVIFQAEFISINCKQTVLLKPRR